MTHHREVFVVLVKETWIQRIAVLAKTAAEARDMVDFGMDPQCAAGGPQFIERQDMDDATVIHALPGERAELRQELEMIETLRR